MKISCCWLYAISKYGYPPSLDKTFRVLGEMKALGFNSVELEGVRRDNLLEVHAKRHELEKFCDGNGLRVINFCPVLPQSVSLVRGERRASWTCSNAPSRSPTSSYAGQYREIASRR